VVLVFRISEETLITIGIMLVIKHVIIDENKIMAKIEDKKRKSRTRKVSLGKSFRKLWNSPGATTEKKGKK
jgi:YidC/Oxa1 family membrane protein insertase